ncbi:NNP family nitrate/nitrite transporter-like MFS transporter [Arthrobacter stackebrandtii]|uniref:NNP family nitrate/nitrite transporter-like MFS transporter n=1 Tax=Arthrobacter stackebrandtii TaxID=272161 RepID=A0ABS4YRS5_9MICC|nr:NNP family nitrate/nitrite transporter-like MFS transporter [Arthrobacter stackebrandtii]PYH00240.1 MFS transporter [Arthrobacter stackebrandtii]
MTVEKMDGTATAAGHTGAGLHGTRGRWLHGWDPEDLGQWTGGGRAIARRNLAWSIACEFLGFVVWQLWSIVVVFLPAAGFTFSSPELFWLISIPSLVGATLRIPYTFMVARFGGRNWTIVSALLLLLPTLGMAWCLGNPGTPFPAMLAVAALAGLGGGNFASSMANITFFYPAREKGWALGLNAAGGNLGAAVAQFMVPLAVALLASGTLGLPVGGLMWVPLILVAAWGAWRFMDNLASAKSDVAGSLAALREPHLWILALLYIGTFGSFIGFAAVFPKLIMDSFGPGVGLSVGPAVISLAFLGALVGSLARPWGGRLADRWGGARVTVGCFGVLAVAAMAQLLTLPLGSFPLFLLLFLVLFTAAGAGNGSTYRMIPMVFALRAADGRTGAARKASAALGIISAIGAYGGFLVPQLLNASRQATGGYGAAFAGFVACYLVLMAVTWAVYLRPSSAASLGRI